MSEWFPSTPTSSPMGVEQGRDSVVLGVIAQIGEDSIRSSTIVISELRFGADLKGS
ncbi:hypothetical protein R1A27_30985 (plasmid) [Methylobacterium sp. NMS12]|uniref:hypothetical protein n=1 Tax=Methylobacterium sp. NMS12 TaxID=3079766 RepID=UPI003F885D46